MEASKLTYPILQIALIGEVNQLGIIGKEYEGGWVDGCLHRPIHLQSATRLARRDTKSLCFFDNVVQQ